MNPELPEEEVLPENDPDELEKPPVVVELPVNLFLFNLHNQIQKMRVSCDIRVEHIKLKRNVVDITSVNVSKKLEAIEKDIAKEIEALVDDSPVWLNWAQNIKGIGKYSLSKIMCVTDIHIATTPSKLLRFAGFDPRDKRRKGEKLHFCMPLKVHCWKVGLNLIRAKGKYYAYYLSQKQRYVERSKANGLKIVKGKESEGQISEGHIHAMAMRKMIKLFLCHLWTQWRIAERLPLRQPYAIEYLGHETYYSPEEFMDLPHGTLHKPPKK